VAFELGPHPLLDVRLSALGSAGIDRAVVGGLLDAGLGAGRVDLCAGGPSRWRARPRGCAGLAAGAVRWVARGVPNSRADVAAWLAGALAAELRVALTAQVGLQLGAGLLVPILRPEYVYEALDETRRLKGPPVALLAAFGPVFAMR
jgi:hypothetical protein